MIGPKVGARREAEVDAWGDDAVVKLCRPGYLGHRAESVALANLDGHSVAPRLIDIVDCDGRPRLVLERLGGSDMPALVQRQPWRVLGLARAPARARLAVHGIHATGDPPDLRQVLAARIENAALPPRLRALRCGFPAGCRPAIAGATVTFTPAVSWSLPTGSVSSTGRARPVVCPKPATRARSCCCGGPIRCPARP